MKRIITALLFLSHGTFAQQIEGEVELAGFVLGQYRKTVHTQLGPPIQQRHTEDGWIYEFHLLKPDTSVYALFKYAQWDTTRIYAIQINGEHDDEIKPFRGLKLGAKKELVNHVLGAFDKKEVVDDPPVVVQYYPHKNYSVEIDNHGNLYGIQIFGNILNNKPAHHGPSIRQFRNAILTRNIDSLVACLSPDVELYKGNKILRYTGAARSEFKKHDSEFVKLLLGETGSVWYVFAKEMAEGTSETRLHPEHQKMTVVDKFFDSSVISEVVFIPHAGKWKVFEVKFR